MVDIDELRKIFDTHDIEALKDFITRATKNSPALLNPNWHPLGFIHCKLANAGATEIYRLHIWPTTLDPIEAQEHKIHDHLFDVESIVLLGAVENNEFRFDLFNDSPTHKIIDVKYTNDAPILRESGIRGNLAKIESNIFRAGDRYRVNRQIFHETSRPWNEPAITLVRTSNPMNVAPRIAMPINASLPPLRPPKGFPLDEWLTILRNSFS